LYERVVTLGYIADNPNQAEPFLEYHHIHKNKMLIHAEKIFDLEKTIGAKEILTTKENYKIYKNKFQEIACKKCKTKRTMLSWSKLDTASMAKKIGLDGLYFPGFFYPTLQTHATPTSLMARMKDRENGNIGFDEGAQHEWASKSLITAHNLMIYVLMIQNTYFELNIDSEIEERKSDFQEMWGKAWRWTGKSGRFFLFCAGRLKVIFLIVSKAIAGFPQPLMPAVMCSLGTKELYEIRKS
jgi:hypothetical protein